MSTNEIELTFIRCQNCKSLMPSTAQGCGMCGFQRPDAGDAKSKNRLRQQSDVNVNEILTESRNETREDKQEEKPVSDGSKESNSFRAKDPGLKRDYLNFGAKPKQEESFEDDGDDEDYESGDFDDDSEEDYPEAVNNSSSQSFSENNERPKKKRRRRKKKNQNTVPTQAVPQDHSQAREEGVVQSREIVEPARFDKVESEKLLEKQNFSLDRNTSGFDRQSSEKHTSEKQNFDKPKFERAQAPVQAPVQAPAPAQAAAPSYKVDERRVSSSELDKVREERPMNNSHSKPVQSAVDGTLVGWLVNYSTNSKGVAFELRVGRRFIGRQALRNDDLVIQDSAVSTPHSLIHVEKGQVVIQDLMSETGTFVKVQNGNEFVRKDASTKLQHGDVLKLGSYELVVCLIPN